MLAPLKLHICIASLLISLEGFRPCLACSFIASFGGPRFGKDELEYINSFSKRRGPDGSNLVEAFGWTWLHNLLHLTGARRPQPFINEKAGLAVLFNGEIYNWRDLVGNAQSDGEVLLPLFREFGPKFPSLLDGEFAIVLWSEQQKTLLLATDPFGTKPLWFAGSGPEESQVKFMAASYRSAIARTDRFRTEAITPLPPNTITEFRVTEQSWEIVSRATVYEFDLRQFKTSPQDFWQTFARAVMKRSQDLIHPFFVGLSTGYDSGLIHLSLVQLGIPHVTISILGDENPSMLERRVEFGKDVNEAWLPELALNTVAMEKDWLASELEPFNYTHRVADTTKGIINDPASCALSFMCRAARDRGLGVYMSGTGADEIISDYVLGDTFRGHQTSFGGVFPANLSELFPWQEFFLSTQHDYLMKEELIAGSHGVEARYPFLDTAVVQEYLWLSHDYKNSKYKAPLHDVFKASGYPFVQEKVGFSTENQLLHPAHPAAVLSKRFEFPPVRCEAPSTDPAKGYFPSGIKGIKAICMHGLSSHVDLRAACCPVECHDGWRLLLNTLRCTSFGLWSGHAECVESSSVAAAAAVDKPDAKRGELTGDILVAPDEGSQRDQQSDLLQAHLDRLAALAAQRATGNGNGG